MLTLTSARMKLAEELSNESGLSFDRLMQNAGSVAYEFLKQKLSLRQKTCAILVGTGNNAGDGFVIAKKLIKDGGTVTVILCDGPPKTPLAKAHFAELPALKTNVINGQTGFQTAALSLSSVEVIIDAVYGTGFHGKLLGCPKSLIDIANKSKATRVSLDIPSGAEADEDKCDETTFKADFTLAFGALKPVHIFEGSKQYCGEAVLLDIGIPEEIIKKAVDQKMAITDEMVSRLLPKRNEWAHKGSFGSLLNISGSASMCGAAMMSTLAALRTGVGITVLATPSEVAKMVAPHLMEAMTHSLLQTDHGGIAYCKDNLDAISKLLEKSTACLIGCGLTATESSQQIVEYVINNTNCNIIIDADALNCVAKDLSLLKRCKKTPIITPHIGEMARLTGMTTEQVTAHSKRVAQVFSKEHGCVVVLKGHNTIIATPQGDLFENRTGNVCLAKGGSGDVLAGMVASFTAQGLSGANAAIAAVYLHGSSADRLIITHSNYSVLARDIIELLPYEMKRIT